VGRIKRGIQLVAYAGQSAARCTVCSHIERARIELLIAGGGASHRALGRKYNLSHHAIGRHWQNHVTEERKAALILGPVERVALASRVAEESESVFDHFRTVRSGLYDLFQKSLEAADGQTGAMLSGRLLECLNSMARLTGQLATSPLIQHNTTTINNLNLRQNPELVQLKADLIRVLSRHPAALADVIHEFERMDAVQVPALEHQQEYAHGSAAAGAA
jgi:hypothetical protein